MFQQSTTQAHKGKHLNDLVGLVYNTISEVELRDRKPTIVGYVLENTC